jgi:hypothetical protein
MSVYRDVYRNAYVDPDRHDKYLAVVAKIGKLDPDETLPDPSDMRALEKATQILDRLEARRYVAPPSQEDRDFLEVQRVNNELVKRMDWARRAKDINFDDMKLPKCVSDNLGDLIGMAAEVEERIKYYSTTTPKERALLDRLTAMTKRIAALESWKAEVEQELSHT